MDRVALTDEPTPGPVHRMLTCPVCAGPLASTVDGVVCPAGHRFDRARQGYLNLLPVHHKKSRDPGDNQAMVDARRDFLDAGHYAPVAARLAERAAERTPRHWLDIGCGEGYYTAHIAQALPESDGYALDISRPAVKRACRRSPHVTWLIASMARIPLADGSCELLASVFSPLDWQEVRRLVSPGGGLMRVGPARDHLIQLRERIYDDVRTYVDDKHLAQVPADLHLVHSENLTYALELTDRQSRADLLAMTPHGWRAGADRRRSVIDQEEPFVVTVSVRFDYLQRQD